MIEIKKLSKKYDKTYIFNKTDYTFPSKGLVSVLGPSGCGKTTLLNIFAGFDTNYTGEILIDNTCISHMNENELCIYRRNNIGFIFQNYCLIKGYSVLENVMLACCLNDLDETENILNAKRILIHLGLEEHINKKIEDLSGGQKQRVAIARALINNPRIILADEPTGALDRAKSNEIMSLLKEISKDCLVLLITHDKKNCDFADEVIHIKDGKIVCENENRLITNTTNYDILMNNNAKVNSYKHGFKNFKVHIKMYIGVALAISIGILSFILSLSTDNVIKKSIEDFKDKNTAFNNGYIKVKDKDDTILNVLKSDDRIDNVYYQYILNNVSLSLDDTTEIMKEKYPMPKTNENMSYGIMPRISKNEISLSPSLAKKFSEDISHLIGKNVIVKLDGKEFKLTVSGIFNADYDDFFVSSDIEQELYNIQNNQIYSINFDVKDFNDIIPVNKMLTDKKIECETAVKQVEALQDTFKNISQLFLVISILILLISLFISITLLVKLQNSRYREIGLLAALGYNKNMIRKMIITENILLAILATIFNIILTSITYLVSIIFNLTVIMTFLQIIISIISTALIIVIISIIASHKLITTEPATALKK